MADTTTKKLNDVLQGVDTLKQMEKFMETAEAADKFKNFPPYYRSLTQVKHLPDTDLIVRSGIEKSYYYQIIKGTRKPGRDKVLRLCFAANLTHREATRALELSGNAPLYPKNRRDIILSVALNQGATVHDATLLLEKYGEPVLG